MIWRLARRERVLDTSVVAVIGMIVAIGLGSFLFHTRANGVTRWIDILPIFIFQLLRSIDISVCSGFELATHFLWHIFNALLIYPVMLALILNIGAWRAS